MIDLTRPVPCKAFTKQPFSDQLAHLDSEVEEAKIAYGDYITAQYIDDSLEVTAQRERVAEELTDVITAATTALEMLDYDQTARETMQALVNEKNRLRGYWEE